MPVTIFNIPGIVPLVPGGLAYQAVRNIVIGNYEKGAYFTVQAVIAGAIALGLVASEVFNQNIRSFREKENLWVLFVVNATKLKIDSKSWLLPFDKEATNFNDRHIDFWCLICFDFLHLHSWYLSFKRWIIGQLNRAGNRYPIIVLKLSMFRKMNQQAKTPESATQ